jgi:hypothetical protein
LAVDANAAQIFDGSAHRGQYMAGLGRYLGQADSRYAGRVCVERKA